jgi:hypothetical protein
LIVHQNRAGLDIAVTAHAHRHHLTRLEVHGLVHLAGADFRALSVQQNGYGKRYLAVQRLDPVDDPRRAIVIGMRHVEAHQIHARVVKRLELLEAVGGGPDGADDLGTAVTHAR